MNSFTLASSFMVTIISLLALKPLAPRLGLLDVPGGRKTHQAPTPLIGGIGIYLGTLFICFFHPTLLAHYAPLLALSTIVLVTGLLDDYREIPASTRMVVQSGAALLMALVAGNELSSFGNLLGFGVIELGLLALPVTMFATVGVINAVNMSDGIDGLSGGLVIFALAFTGAMAWQAGNIEVVGFTATLVCALLGFLILNNRLALRRPALIYLGDAGSTFLGFVLAWLLIECTQGANPIMPPALALWFMAVPLIDTVTLLIRRPLEGRSPFSPGRDHLHHRLMAAGLPVHRTVVTLYLASFGLAMAGLQMHKLGASEAQLFWGFMALFATYNLVLTALDNAEKARQRETA